MPQGFFVRKIAENRHFFPYIHCIKTTAVIEYYDVRMKSEWRWRN